MNRDWYLKCKEAQIVKIPFKVATIEDYKMCMNMDERLLKFIDDNFELSSVSVKPLNSNCLVVTDQKGESLIFTVKDEKVIWFDKDKVEEVLKQDNVIEHDLELEPGD